MVHQQQIGVAHDSLEHVVEVVRHATCQFSNGLHLLGLSKLQFECALLGRVDVRKQSPPPHRLPHAPPRTRRNAPTWPRRQQAPDQAERFRLTLRRGGDSLGKPFPVPLCDDGQDRARLGGVHSLEHGSEQSRERTIGPRNPAVTVDGRDRERSIVEEPREPNFGRTLALRHVLTRRAIEDKRTRRAGHAVIAKGDAMEQAHRQ